jgi:hypothetical protein
LVFRTEHGDRLKLATPTRVALRQLSRRSARSGRLSPLAYNLTISHANKFMWFRVAKVGTRSIFGHFTKYDVPLDLEHAMRMRYPTDLFEDYFKFAFVRHPLGRFMSAWRNKVVNHNYFGFDSETLSRMQRVENFAAWVATFDLSDLATADHHLALQSRLIDLTQIDYLGRLESFDDDFAAVCHEIGVPVSHVEPLNQTRREDDEPEPVSDELRSLVTKIYRRDLQVFGY